MNSEQDYWVATMYTVQYNGTVEKYSTYNLSGQTDTIHSELTIKQYKRLRELLDGDFQSYSCDTNGCDGNAWYIDYYDINEESIHDFFGYVYGHKALEEITDILCNANNLMDSEWFVWQYWEGILCN